MDDVAGLLAAVDRAFERTAAGLARWPDPHPDRSVTDDEYSRLTDPGRWRILGARAEAWIDALVATGRADVERDATVVWAGPVGPRLRRADRVVPRVDRALTLVVARSWIGDVDDAGVVLGVGDPAVCVRFFPDCGCDACDSGAQDELDHLDVHLRGVVSGRFRRLSDGKREITVIGDGGWSASGGFARGEVDAVLAGGRGWTELAGASWLPARPR